MNPAAVAQISQFEVVIWQHQQQLLEIDIILYVFTGGQSVVDSLP